MSTGLERRLAKLERIAPQDKNLQTLGELIKDVEEHERELAGDPFRESGPIWVSFADGLGVQARDHDDFYQKITELKHCGKVDDGSLVRCPTVFISFVKPRYRADGSVDPPPHQATGR
jgi:hypothetical protein